MILNISNSNIKKIPVTGKQYDVRDVNLKGFMIRVTAKGEMHYVCQYKRGKRVNIGPVNVLSSAQARIKAIEILGDASKNIFPTKKERLGTDEITLKEFIINHYEPWFNLNRKSAEKTMSQMNNFMSSIGHKKLKDITPFQVETWRTDRIKNGIAKATVNRNVAVLKSALSKALEWDIIKEHPIKNFKLLKIDSNPIIRYLSINEEKALRQALETREQNVINKRKSGNQWREERNYNLYNNLDNLYFIDHLKPMVLISINTGLRRGELFNLTWDMIDFDKRILTVYGNIAKSGKSRHVPLNNEAYEALFKWYQQANSTNNLVFPGKNGNVFSNIKKSWLNLLKLAGIEKFRWHDMRHHFASKLVMAGVDLNTVRELLGHSEISMTLRYAHLAPEHKAEAVAKLIY
tara:strand:- start:352 stop:1566 length:1215 start_codon:yes stop_codon:yes gene_type:complete